MFKKKSLKFTYEKVRRDLRHAEALKTRESSRFKRLSVIRSINDSDFLEVEAPKELIIPEKKKPSRLEMLFKWKQEKQMKKEIEKQAKKKPFYVGGKKGVVENKTLQSLKSSFTAQPNSSFNSSKFVKSKLITPTTTTVQSSRILNSKQGTPNSSTKSARLPNSKQVTPSISIQPSRILNSKQGISTQPVRPSNSKQAVLPKSVGSLCRSNSTATLSRKFPVSTVDKAGSLVKPGSSLTRSNSTAAMPKKIPVSSLTISKVAPSKAAIQRAPFSNKTSNNASNNVNSIKSKNVPNPVNKVSVEQKTLPKPLTEKPFKKIGTGLPKITSNVTGISRGISVQNKVPVSNINKKFGSNPNLKETSQNKENVSLRRGYCFRTAISNSIRQQNDTSLKTPVQGTPKKQLEKISKKVEEKSSIKEISEQSVDNIPDVTFNSDISIIKPARTSFAPSNFTFQPPEGLNNFVFEDEDYDVYQDLEEVKLKFMSRTSTPSKDSGRKSSIQNSKDSVGSNNVITAAEKTSDISNSNEIRISELMSPESIRIKVDNKIMNEEVDLQICNEVASNVITNIGINDSEADIATKQETFQVLTSISAVKTETDVTEEEACKETASISPLNIEIKACEAVNPLNSEELPSTSSVQIEDDGTVKDEICQKVASVSPVSIEIKEFESINQKNSEELSSNVNRELHKMEITDQTVVGELQTNLCCEKQLLNDSDITENTKGAFEVLNSEKQVNQFHTIGSSDRTIEDKFLLDDDDSLLDSIDLNKIQLMQSDDEDTDGDDVASPQILKCSERKSNGAIPKRVSMLKQLSVMNSIAETSETDEHVSANASKSSKKSEVSRSTPQRSKRMSNHLSLDVLKNSPVKNNADSPTSTPRRSLRLMKRLNVSNNFPVSPFQEKNMGNVNPRRHSVRLIDLSTPEKDACEKLLGENFENLDPNDFLIDFESPTIPAFPKSKKVSLLYSPEKRKSMRKSIRGDLISFSPV